MENLKYPNNMIICGLLGDPVEHSISSQMFYSFAKSVNLKNYIHIKFRIPKRVKGELKRAIDGIKVFNLRGFNITLPYKEKVIKYVDCLDNISKKIGAVNTIVNKNGKIYGFNTDGIGAIISIEKSSRKIETTDKVVIMGAGGCSRAICSEVYSRTKNLVIVNRSMDEAHRVKKQLERWGGKGVRCLELNKDNLKKELISANFIFNATPVGMYPNVNHTLISKNLLDYLVKQRGYLTDVICWDAILNPYETLFLKEAKKHGAKVIGGLGMMIYQGIGAFKIWTGKKIDLCILPKIERELIRTLKNNQ